MNDLVNRAALNTRAHQGIHTRAAFDSLRDDIVDLVDGLGPVEGRAALKAFLDAEIRALMLRTTVDPETGEVQLWGKNNDGDWCDPDDEDDDELKDEDDALEGN